MSIFTTVDLASYFNSDRSSHGWHKGIGSDLNKLPAGRQIFWGIPFVLGPLEGKCWVSVDRQQPDQTIRVSARATYIVIAHFCDESHDPEGKRQPVDYNPGEVTRPGEHLADYTFIYVDGSDYRRPIRRRFEIGEALILWGQWSFAARPHVEDESRNWRGPFSTHEWGAQWGWRQSTVRPSPGRNLQYWLFALPNPRPDVDLSGVRVSSIGDGRIAIAGMTLSHGKEHPLRY